MQDIRAGLAARHLEDPDARLRKYREGRYGPLKDAASRQAVFVDFLIDAMARWLAGYRASLSLGECASLSARFQSPEGRAILSRATARYNAQDVHDRGLTAPVISELLRTLDAAERTP